MPGRSRRTTTPIFIADAAMYLMATNPDLGITDPYELTQEQFDASVDLLKQQHAELTGAPGRCGPTRSTGSWTDRWSLGRRGR